jgi:surface protein
MSKSTRINSKKTSYATAVNKGGEFTGTDYSGREILDGKYVICRRMDVFSGEADLYICRGKNRCEYVVKIYRRADAIKTDVLRQLSGVSSPYVASVVDYGNVDGLPFTVLPYFRKGSLSGRTFTLDYLKSVVIPSINEGLRDLHKSSIIHKDIKPSNLMLSDNEDAVRIIDFGISSVMTGDVSLIKTTTGMSLAYSAPETFSGTYLRDSDYYSFGITLYEIFTGFHPFRKHGSDDMAAMASLMKIPFSDDFPDDLRSLIRGLTYKDLTYRNDEDNPNRRWGHREVEAWLGGEKIPVPGEEIHLSGSSSASEVVRDREHFSVSYKFRRRELHTLQELTEAFGLNWEEGRKHVGRGLLSAFFKTLGEQDLASCVMDCEAAEVSDIAYFKMLFEISGGKGNLYWRGVQYRDIREFAAALVSSSCCDDGCMTDSVLSLFDVVHLLFRDEPQKLSLFENVREYVKSLGDAGRRSALFNLCLFMWDGDPDILVRYSFSGKKRFDDFSSLALYLKDQKLSSKEILDFLKNNHRLLAGCRYLYLRETAGVFQEFDQRVTDLLYNVRYEIRYEDLAEIYSGSELQDKGIFTVDSMLVTMSQVRIAMAGKRFVMLRFNVLPPGFFSDFDEQIPDFVISLGPQVTDLSRMFSGCSRLMSLPRFDTSHVTDMSEMFRNCSSLQFVPQFDTSNVESMRFMFSGCGELAEIPEFNVSPGVDFRGIVSGCGRVILSGKLPSFLAGRPRGEIFSSSEGDEYAGYGSEYSDFSTDRGYDISDEDFLEMEFSDHVKLQRNTRTLVLLQGNAEDLDRNYMIREAVIHVAESYGKVSISSYSGVVLFNALVRDLESINFSVSIDGSVTSLSGMFEGCWALEKIPLIDTSRVQDMSRMFFGCSRIRTIPPISTSSLVNAVSMFEGCSSLEELPFMDTSRTEYMDRMFYGCYSLPFEMNFARNSLRSAVDMYEGCTAMYRDNGRYYVFGTAGNRRYVPVNEIREGTVIPEYDLHRDTGGVIMNILKFVFAFFVIMVIVGACAGSR